MIELTREPFSDTFVLTLPNGHTEELEPEEARVWFTERGADKHKLEEVLDDVWNFYQGTVVINNYREPALKHPKYQPNV